MSQLKLELVIEASDELIKLIENEGVIVRGLSFTLSEKVSGPSIRLQSHSKIDNAYASILVTELQLRGFDFEKLPLLSRERIRALVFQMTPRKAWRLSGTEELREQDCAILEIGRALGVTFLERGSCAPDLIQAIGSRKAHILGYGLGIKTLADLETARLSEIDYVRNIGPKSMEELAKVVEDGTIKLAK